MANDLIVVTAASDPNRGTLPLYREQLTSAGIDFHVEDISHMVIPPLGGNSAIKVRSMRELSERFAHYEKIVFTDAFDMQFFPTMSREEICQKIPSTHVLWGAEKNCYPDPNIAPLIPDRGAARFANGGWLCGTPARMIEWTQLAQAHPFFNGHMLDQQMLNMLLASNDPLCVCDHTSELVFCLFGGYPELDFEDGLPVNRLFGTRPPWIHANGHYQQHEMNTKREASLCR